MLLVARGREALFHNFPVVGWGHADEAAAGSQLTESMSHHNKDVPRAVNLGWKGQWVENHPEDISEHISQDVFSFTEEESVTPNVHGGVSQMGSQTE